MGIWVLSESVFYSLMISMLRYGKPVAEKLEKEVADFVAAKNLQDRYVAIIMIGAEHPWAAYVRSKQNFAERVWLSVKIFWNEDKELTEVDILKIINTCNEDDACVGTILQLPLPANLEDSKQTLLDAIHPKKDIDALCSIHQQEKYLLPATPMAVLQMINYYKYDLQGKTVAMLWNSNLIWKPLAFALEYKGAIVQVFTIESDQEEMKRFCREKADIIISATGHIHLVDESFVRDDKSQVVIDVGRGYKDGKAVGDVQRETLIDKVAAVTPVPWGVWPVTVASLFTNIMTLQK